MGAVLEEVALWNKCCLSGFEFYFISKAYTSWVSRRCLRGSNSTVNPVVHENDNNDGEMITADCLHLHPGKSKCGIAFEADDDVVALRNRRGDCGCESSAHRAARPGIETPSGQWNV